jgi:hypothetical protein
LTETGTYNQVSQEHFLLCHRRDSLLHGVASYKSVDHDLVLLANAVSARKGLDVGVGVLKILE